MLLKLPSYVLGMLLEQRTNILLIMWLQIMLHYLSSNFSLPTQLQNNIILISIVDFNSLYNLSTASNILSKCNS